MDQSLYTELKIKATLWAVLVCLTGTLAHQTASALLPSSLPSEVVTVTTPGGQTLTIHFPGR